MGSLNPVADPKQEMNDSGYVQDELTEKSPKAKKDPTPDGEEPNNESIKEADTPEAAEVANGYTGQTNLLDLSDDVLLCILQYFSPQDLKSLGFTCPRLGSLVLDRTLWVDVDGGDIPFERRRVRWLLARALGPHTRRLRLKGFVQPDDGFSGCNHSNSPDAGPSGSNEAACCNPPPELERHLCGGHRLYRLMQELRCGITGSGPPEGGPPGSGPPEAPSGSAAPREGVQLTWTHTALRGLASTCTYLTSLELDYCYIDCHTTNIGMFPKIIKKLSLRGSKCINVESKSFLFKIQDHLLNLEELDVSYCDWIEPACMLPLSKMPSLHSLHMRSCLKLAEFVAYASLATRYGFKRLKYLDLRGSPVGDSEVSALGWLPLLEELYLSPVPSRRGKETANNLSATTKDEHRELAEWEKTEPDYFKAPQVSEEDWLMDEQNVRGAGNRTSYYNNDDPSSCILLERMIAEPVAPDEYSQVYNYFLTGHNTNLPLANPIEYRVAYDQYMLRPYPEQAATGYSLFGYVRRPEERRPEERRPEERRPEERRPEERRPEVQRPEELRPPRDEATPAKRRRLEEPAHDNEAAGPSHAVNAAAKKAGTSQNGKNESGSSNDKNAGGKDGGNEAGTSKVNEAGTSKGNEAGTSNDGNKEAKNDVKDTSKNDAGTSKNKSNGIKTTDTSKDEPGTSNDTQMIKDNSEVAGTKTSDAKSDKTPNKIEKDQKPQESKKRKDGDDDSNDEDAFKELKKRMIVADPANNYFSKLGDLSNEFVDELIPGTSNDSNINKKRNNDESDSKDTKKLKNDDNNENPSTSSQKTNDATHSKDNDEKPGETSDKSNDNDAKDDEKPSTSSQNKNGTSEDTNKNKEKESKVDVIAINEDLRQEPTLEEIQRQRLYQFRQYRRPIVIEEYINVYNDNGNNDNPGIRIIPDNRGMQLRDRIFAHASRLDHSALVSDSSIRRFGRADGENINYIHIGPNGPMPAPFNDPHARPNRSNLRVLSVTGFRHVTNVSLTHLTTAAPFLVRLNLSGTGVTAAAVETFKILRPDCEVVMDEVDS